jgi:uncharacterized membrane-anchored protein YjiN (DUF445 family)
MPDDKIDIGKLAQGQEPDEPITTPAQIEPNYALTPVPNPAHTVIHQQDIAWIEATQGLQRNLIRSLQDYKATRADRRALAVQRQHMITEVTENYVQYLREEARLSSEVALKARDSILKQELAKLRAKLFAELADITGVAVVEIERIAQGYSSKINSPAIQQAYAKFVMDKILALLEQSNS